MPWMIDRDGAEHTKRRKLVNRGFTPGRVRATEPHLRDICDDLIDRVCERGECDFVRDLAAPLPMIVIGDMLGVAPSDRDDLLRWSHGMLASLTGEPAALEAAAAAFNEYLAYAHRMIAARRAEPTDDLFSVLVHAIVDGDRLDDDEIVFEALLLLIGGDETTRQVTAGGMEVLLEHPEQKQNLLDDPELLPSGVEEMLRWVSPIKNMARTTTVATEIAGVTIPEASKVVLLYESANFDDTHFRRAGRLRRRAFPERPPRVRIRAPLLSRGQPGPVRAPGDVRATVPPHARPRAGHGRPAPAVDHRHRADAGGVLAVPTDEFTVNAASE